jgi:hypothetical protein
MHDVWNSSTGQWNRVSSRFPDGYVSVNLPDADEPEEPLVAMDSMGLEPPVSSDALGTRDPVLEIIEAEERRWDVKRPWFARFFDQLPRGSMSLLSASSLDGKAVLAPPIKVKPKRKLGARRPSARATKADLRKFAG